MFVGARRLAVAALVAGLVAGTAGCSGSSDKPPTLPPLSTTPAASTATPSPRSEKTELAAATAVVREYFRLINAPTTLRSARALAALMTKQCKCREVARSTRVVAERGQHYFGKTTPGPLRPALDAPGHVDVLANYDYTDSGIKTADGRVIRQSAGRVGATIDFRLVHVGGRWLITALIYVREGQPA